jgi:mercuric reductase
MQTSHPRIYAAGDVTNRPKLVYVAAAAGGIAAENALNGNGRQLDLRVLPDVIFTDPQVATVGLTEAQARASKYEVKVTTLPLAYVPRALAARDTRGMIKLVADKVTGQLLGGHILAAEGGEVVQAAALAIKFGATIDDLTSTLFPYLTQVEGLKLAAQTFDKDVSKLSCCAG